MGGPMSKMIVVDDEDAMEILFRHMFKEEIKQNIFDLRFYVSAQEALEAMKEFNDISIVLTDINMPRMDGFEFVEVLNDQDFKSPVLMISAYDDKDRLQRAKDMGVIELIPKPIDFDYLRKRVNEITKTVN